MKLYLVVERIYEVLNIVGLERASSTGREGSDSISIFDRWHGCAAAD